MNADQQKQKRPGRYRAKIDADEFDLGAAVLMSMRRPGRERFSHHVIAAACGVSHGWVFAVEKKALRKIREKLRRELHLSFGEFAVTKLEDVL